MSERSEDSDVPDIQVEPEQLEDACQVTEEDKIPEHKEVAVIFAHPDDPDFSCAGTVAKWTDEGHEVTYVILTDGSKGSHDTGMTPQRLIELRQEEQRAASAVVGVNEVIFLGREDGML